MTSPVLLLITYSGFLGSFFGSEVDVLLRHRGGGFGLARGSEGPGMGFTDEGEEWAEGQVVEALLVC